MNKNQEGYHDPIACEAVRRVSVRKKKAKHKYHLHYRLADLRSFQKVVQEMML